jgi:hypothetical protein
MPSVDISGITVATPTAVDLYVSAFQQSIELSELASLLKVPEISFDVSCTTDIDMSIEAFKSVFQFSIENYAVLGDIANNVDDLHFYVQDASLSYLQTTIDGKSISIMGQNIIPASGNAVTYLDYKTGGSPLPDAQLNVASDFTRYLAKEIFGTPAGVDLFYNEQAILTDISNAFQNRWVTGNLNGILLPISSKSGTDSHLEVDASYGKYLDNTDPNGAAVAYNNITKVLFDQLLALAPARFSTDPETGLIQDLAAHQPQPIPFFLGDTVSWVLKIKPAKGQESLITGTTDTIKERTYRVRMHLKNLPTPV